MRLFVIFTIFLTASFHTGAHAQSYQASSAVPENCQPTPLAGTFTALERTKLKIRLPQGWALQPNPITNLVLSPDKKATIQISGPTKPSAERNIASMIQRIESIYVLKRPVVVEGKTMVGQKIRDFGLKVNDKPTRFVEIYQDVPAGQRRVIYGVYEDAQGQLYEISSIIDQLSWHCQQNALFKALASIEEVQ